MAKNRDFLILDKPLKRREQLASWVEENLRFFGYPLDRVAADQNRNLAYNRFKGIINTWLVVNENDSSPFENQSCIYIVNKNIKFFGKEILYIDLFQLIFRGVKFKERKELKEEERPKEKIVSRKREKVIKTFFGTTKGKREKAVLVPIKIKGKEFYRLRSLKTGRFLASSKAARKEAEKRIRETK